MPPRSEALDFNPPMPGFGADNLVVQAESPPAWSETLQWVPFLGTHLNIVAQTQHYYTPLEDCVDFIARDLHEGLGSEYVGKRVSVKAKSKVAGWVQASA